MILQKWLETARVYFDRRMLTMLGLGFSSGFPFLLVGGTLALWLTDAHISLEIIGLFALVKIPYSFKWLWSPLTDRLHLPFFGRFGRRRGWALFSQSLLIFSILAMAAVNPANSVYLMMFLAALAVFASATQDIVLDAFRVECFTPEEQGAGAAIFILGYRIGFIFSGAVALLLAAVISWNEVYVLMSALSAFSFAANLKSEPHRSRYKAEPLYKSSKTFIFPRSKPRLPTSSDAATGKLSFCLSWSINSAILIWRRCQCLFMTPWVSAKKKSPMSPKFSA